MRRGCPWEWGWPKRGDAHVNVTAKGKLRPWDTNLVSRVLENEKTLGTRLNLIGLYSQSECSFRPFAANHSSVTKTPYWKARKGMTIL